MQFLMEYANSNSISRPTVINHSISCMGDIKMVLKLQYTHVSSINVILTF